MYPQRFIIYLHERFIQMNGRYNGGRNVRGKISSYCNCYNTVAKIRIVSSNFTIIINTEI